MMKLSQDQDQVITHVLEWFSKDKIAMPYVTIGGYAGTGKTTIIAVLREKFHQQNGKLVVGFASYTGKAARVLQSKLAEQHALYTNDTVSTIHSLIYSPILNDKQEIVGWKKKDSIEQDLIIIDEASMVDGIIWEHLVSYGKPMIVVGDHGQLPPIAGNFNLIQKPNLLLSEIHRQARNNPIIELSIQARENGIIEPKRYSSHVIKYEKSDPEGQERMQELLGSYSSETLILCGYNSSRKRMNAYIRGSLGFETPEPLAGDRVICLRNNHKQKIYNGMLGIILHIAPKDSQWFEADIAMDGEEKPYSGLISRDQFRADSALNFTDKRSATVAGDLFDFGYALTVHKAQGSQAKRVVLFEERFPKMTDDQWKRWLYTAVTRAEEELYIF